MEQSEIEDLLRQKGYNIKSKSVIDVTDDKGQPIVSIFVDDKYLQFHDCFTQIGITMPLMEFLMNNGFTSNHC